jgi:cytochrome c oxidase subunit 2
MEDFRLFPEQASTMASRFDALFGFITAVVVFFTVVIAVLVMYFAVRYRRRSEDQFPKPVVGSSTLEWAWTIGPLLIGLVMFGWGASLYFEMVRPPEDALDVYVTGRQWMWHLHHLEGQREINALHVPVGKPVKLIMTSEDVIHSFFVPAFRVKQDVLPGRYTYLWFQATKAGRYRLYCAEYCGTDHSQMVGYVTALEPAEYEDWLQGQGLKADRSLATQGRQLFQKLQCVTCHHAEAGNRGPLLEGIYGSVVELDTGRRIRVDESYLTESILYPQAKIRAGFRRPSIMPSFKGQVTNDDLIRLIAFLKALGPGQTPPRVEKSDAPEDKTKKK